MKRQYAVILGVLILLGGLAPQLERGRGSHPAVEPADAIRVFAGSVVRQGDNFILNDPANKIIYTLDDAETASSYEGKKVKVTGILDLAQDMIRMERIEIIG